jgi:Ca2+-binding EF-hand superfamily protein
MTVSAIGQGMSMSSLYGMQKPSAGDIVKKILGDLDTNGDGALSTEEIGKAGKFAKDILKADANGDGIVTQDELLSDITKKMENGMMPPPPPMGGMQPNADNMASKIIDDLDTNGDGVLSADEISKAGKLAQNILGADTDGDGIVTKDELSADITKKMASNQAAMQQHRASHMAQRIMDKLDTDGNGALSTDEISNGGDGAQSIQPADTNRDGVVSIAELIAYLSQTVAGSQTSESQLNSLV